MGFLLIQGRVYGRCMLCPIETVCLTRTRLATV